MPKKLYEILGITDEQLADKTADIQKIISDAFKKKQIQYFPEHNLHLSEEERFKNFQNYFPVASAEQILSDPLKRKAYDEGLINDKGERIIKPQPVEVLSRMWFRTKSENDLVKIKDDKNEPIKDEKGKPMRVQGSIHLFFNEEYKKYKNTHPGPQILSQEEFIFDKYIKDFLKISPAEVSFYKENADECHTLYYQFITQYADLHHNLAIEKQAKRNLTETELTIYNSVRSDYLKSVFKINPENSLIPRPDLTRLGEHLAKNYPDSVNRYCANSIYLINPNKTTYPHLLHQYIQNKASVLDARKKQQSPKEDPMQKQKVEPPKPKESKATEKLEVPKQAPKQAEKPKIAPSKPQAQKQKVVSEPTAQKLSVSVSISVWNTFLNLLKNLIKETSKKAAETKTEVKKVSPEIKQNQKINPSTKKTYEHMKNNKPKPLPKKPSPKSVQKTEAKHTQPIQKHPLKLTVETPVSDPPPPSLGRRR